MGSVTQARHLETQAEECSSEEDQQVPGEKSCYHGPQQPDEPPPAYGVAVNMNAAEAGLEFGVLEFGEESVKMACSACHHQINTNVDSQVRQSGWMFALLCCICGSWLISLLVCCLPGFRKYSHYCPHCRALLGEGMPRHSGGHLAIIIGLSILLVGLLIGFAIFVLSMR